MKKYLGTLTALLFFIYSDQRVLAASTTLSALPQAGSYDAPFTVDLNIDGHGDVFNAAEAKVALSSNLTVKNILLGDCGFSFLRTPSISDPSFEGVLLGSSTKKCTAYTLTLIPVKNGAASLSLTNSSVRRYGDAANVLASTHNGTYSVTLAEPSPNIAATSAAYVKDSEYVDTSKVLSATNSAIEAQPQRMLSQNQPEPKVPYPFIIGGATCVFLLASIVTIMLVAKDFKFKKEKK